MRRRGHRRRRGRLRRRARAHASSSGIRRSSWPRSPRAARRAAATTTLPALSRAARARGVRSRPVAERADAALVAYPHKAAAPVGRARCASAGSRSSTCRRTSGSEREPYERWYQPHEAPELLGEAVYGLHRAAPGGDRGRRPRRPSPGCYSTAALLALCPLAGRARRTPSSTPRAGVSGAGREATRDDPLRLGGRERQPLRGRGPPPRRRDRTGAAAACAVTFMPHLLPLDQGLLASCYVTPTSALARRGCGSCSTSLRRRAVRRAGRRAARRARRARHQPLPRST